MSAQKWIRAKLRRLVSLAAALILSLGVLAISVISASPAQAITPCGNPGPPATGVLLLGSDWLQGVGTGGVNVYSNAQGGQPWGFNNCGGTDDYVGGVDAGGEWQCVELVNRLYLTQGWITAHWYGNGDTLVNDVPNHSGLSKQNNGSITSIVPGDVVTFNGNATNSAGHAGIVSVVSGNSITVVNQNVGTPVTQTLTYDPSAKTLTGEYGYTTQAVVHASANTGTGGGGTGPDTSSWSGNFASSWGANRLDIFTVVGSYAKHKYYDSGWGSWDTLGSLTTQIASEPSAVSWGSGRIDLFARAANNDVLHAYYDGTSWHNWAYLPGSACIQGTLGVASWGVNRIDVFAEGCGSTNLEHIYFNGSWQSWETLSLAGATLGSSPSAVSWGVNRIDVFARGSDGSLIQAYYDTGGWHDWANLNGCITGPPTVSSWGADRLDVFAEGCPANGSVNHIWFDGNWESWETLPYGQTNVTPFSAVSWGSGRIDLFGLASNGDLIQQYDDTNGWHDWADLGQP